MKIQYYLMSMALTATALVGFTACDDDDTFENVYVVGADQVAGNVDFSESDVRVKIGEENRIKIPVAGNYADISAYSLDPEVATVVDVDGIPMIEGLQNGATKIMVSDGNGNYEALAVAVYTTDVMKLNYSTLEANAVPGNTAAIYDIKVAEGNGNYSVTSADSRVSASINAETGVLQVLALVEADSYTAVVTVADQSELTADLTVNVSKTDLRVKIGEDTREALPFTGEYTAEMAPSQINAELFTDASGKMFIEGLANGTAVVTAQQGDKYYYYTYSVYTTDVMTLSATSFEMTTPLGIQASNSECSVTAGNGGYTVTSDNDNIQASISYSSGVITISATSTVNEYNATVTVTDCTGLTASVIVTVKASMVAFTDDEIESIKNMNQTVYGQVKDPSDGTVPYYYRWASWGYGEYLNEVADGTHTVGWWYAEDGYWGYEDDGGLKIDFPEGSNVGEEVTGKLYFQYSNAEWYPCYEYEGTCKVIRDDAEKIAVIFYQIDLDNERINRGYVVVNK